MELTSMPATSPAHTDDSWNTGDELDSTDDDHEVPGSVLCISGKIVAEIKDPLPVIGSKSSETAVIMQESIDTAHRYQILAPSKDLDKNHSPTTAALGNGVHVLLFSGANGRFCGMLVEQGQGEETQPAVARLSKKSEFFLARQRLNDSEAGEMAICKWASNLESAPKEVKAAASKYHGFLIADYLVAKRKSQNAARAQRLQEKKKAQGSSKPTLKRSNTVSEKVNKRLKPPDASEEPCSPVKTLEPKPVAKTTPQPKRSAQPKAIAKPVQSQQEEEPPCKKRKVTITIENATEADIRAILRQ